MVKGVNKRVIEVNETGSKYFEKIVFFVTPEYGNLTVGELQKATEFMTYNLSDYKSLKRPTLRQIKKSRRRRVFWSAVGILAVVGVVLILIL